MIVSTKDDARFVLTNNGVVHDLHCGHVRHQVEQHDRGYMEQGRHEYQTVGVDDEGWNLIRERATLVPAGPYQARYVSDQELRASTRKYRRCRVCAPSAPEWTPRTKTGTSVRAQNLTARHVGRVVEGAGTVEEIRIVVRTSAGSIELQLDDAVTLLPRATPGE